MHHFSKITIYQKTFFLRITLYAREIERENHLENIKHKDFFGCTRKRNPLKGKWKKGNDELPLDELASDNDEGR